MSNFSVERHVLLIEAGPHPDGQESCCCVHIDRSHRISISLPTEAIACVNATRCLPSFLFVITALSPKHGVYSSASGVPSCFVQASYSWKRCDG